MPSPVGAVSAASAAWGAAALPPPGTPARARAVAREVEALLLQQLVGALRRTVGEAEPAAAGTELWRDLFDVHLARALAASGGVGLAHLLEAAMTRPGAAPAPPPSDRGRVAPGGGP